MPILHVDTSHENTISGVILYSQAENTFLATGSIDKQVGYFKFVTPPPGKAMKSLAINRGAW